MGACAIRSAVPEVPDVACPSEDAATAPFKVHFAPVYVVLLALPFIVTPATLLAWSLMVSQRT